MLLNLKHAMARIAEVIAKTEVIAAVLKERLTIQRKVSFILLRWVKQGQSVWQPRGGGGSSLRIHAFSEAVQRAD